MSISPSDPTFREFHRILMCGKNPQALIRLYFDVLPLLEGDKRLRFDFSVIPGSHDGHEKAAHRFLKNLENAGKVTVIPWSQAAAYKPELVISASPTPEALKLDAPAVFITHGAGNNRLRIDIIGPYGLAREQLTWNGEVVTWLPLAGEAAFRELQRWCPEAAPNAEVIGDLRYERMLESLLLRRLYRQKLGIGPEEILVVVSSTWGRRSAVGERRLKLVKGLLETLPMDEFKVGFIPHPNIEHGDGPSTAAVMGSRLRNGLLMPPVDEGWAATIIAADVIVGDSGSVTQYAAAIGRPVLLCAFGFDQMPPDGALAAFGRATPWINLDKPFAPQIREAIARGQGFDFSGILATDRSPSRIVHAKVFELLDIRPSPFPGPKILPEPDLHCRCRPTWAWSFAADFGPGLARFERLPVQSHEGFPGLLTVRFEDCDTRVMLTHAKVLLRHRDVLPEDEALKELEGLLEDWAHCQVASARVGANEILVRTRQGLLIRVRATALADVIPSALAAWLLEHPADAAGLGAADALVDFERRFEPPPTILSVERLG